ncbi:MAG: AAA family ATPase, partial [Opitutae bacterium]|nr:AAA family ATPase [Opitutae bacterium]
MIYRIALGKLKELAKGFPIVAVIGPRQSGKTTLVQEAFPKHAYLSLEDLDVRDEARGDARGFLRRQQGDFILDEVQHVPELFNYLQTYVDRKKRMGGVVLTGSQNFLLMERISQSLAGRVGLLPLLPFSWPELKNVTGKDKTLDEVLFAGSYPPIFDRGVSPVDWYPRYVQTYIDRDVRLIRNIGNLSRFQRFVRLCAGRIGQLLNFSNLAADCGIYTKTAQSWMSVLEASHIVFLLRPHFRNFNKRLVKQPKLYFVDTGVACALLGIE